ncbi:MAG: right-handed parallel beta-helix repeat-containing protein [Oceanipulchritudo sp.]
MNPTLHLSPDGNDSHSGLTMDLASPLDGPLKTPFGAIMRVRQLRSEGLLHGTARIIMLPGRYSIHRPIKIYPQDSDITFEAMESGTAEIRGSIEAEGFTKTRLPHGPEAMKKDVSGLMSYHGPFNTLFLNGDRLPRARWPKQGLISMDRFAHRYDEVDIFQGQNAFFAKLEDLPGQWNPGPDVQVNIQHCWVHERQDVESIDMECGLVSLTSKTAINPHFTTIPTAYSLENDLRFLSEPGEWYLDRQSGTLYVIPPHGADTESFRVDIPVTTQWLRLVGDADKHAYVRNVTFKGITFRHADWTMCGPGISRWEPQSDMPPRSTRPVLPHAEDTTEFPRPIGGGVQGACYLPGTIHGQAVENSQFNQCLFDGPSFYGVMLEEGSRNNLIQGCRFRNMGAGGVYLDGSPCLQEAHKHNRGNTIADCEIAGGGHVFHQACGILATHVAWTRILHNRIQDLTYTGISVGWHWSFDQSVNRDQLIIGNHVKDIGLRGDLWDMGGIYLLGYQPGTVVRGNVIENIHCRGFAGWGIYLDEGASGVLVERNLVWKTHSHSLHEHWGRQNTIRNNCFAFGQEGGIAINNEISHSWVRHPAPGSRAEYNVIVTGQRPAFEDFGGLIANQRLEQGFFFHDGNVIWCQAPKYRDTIWAHREDVHDPRSPEDLHTLEMIRQRGMERHGVILDPGIRWDSERQSFSTAVELSQLRGNAALWAASGPRQES